MYNLEPRKKYGFHNLNVGEYLEVPITDGDKTDALRALKAAYSYGSRHGKMFFGKTIEKDSRQIMVVQRYV